uniref:Uncharacterized protein n=1 Tax=Anguilla anguilla TaxID=7936 RepID=A0A0E9QD51_ANGAN
MQLFKISKYKETPEVQSRVSNRLNSARSSNIYTYVVLYTYPRIFPFFI